MERAAVGIPPLKWDANFTATAKIRVLEIPEQFTADHGRPDGRRWYTAITDAGISYSLIGENMARGGHSREGASWYTPQIVMESWMDSPSHRDNILNGNFEFIGIAILDLEGTRYYIQHFGTYRG
jgi:uncharacterized protein YkwD